MDKVKVNMEKIVNYAKSFGFVYQGSELYGGLSNTWDYGPLGVELKNNIKKAWWQKFNQESKTNVGLDSAILMNSEVWVASGHIGGFSDPLMDCKECNTRHRADKLIEDFTNQEVNPGGWSNKEFEDYIKKNEIVCPNCGKKNFTEIRQFELMFKTHQGVLSDEKSAVYLRPETAQGIFVNFKNVARTTRKKIPFGICQIGKSFRNEITPGNFIFRTREFEQMELEFFCKPGEDTKWYIYWRDFCFNFVKSLGIKEERMRLREHSQEELSHYSTGTADIEYQFPFGWGELWGIANRTDYDLSAHNNHSGQSLEYLDPQTNEKYIPYCIEPSVGVERLFLAIFTDSYEEETLANGETREVLHLHPFLAPYKIAVLPLVKKLDEKAQAVYDLVSKEYMTDYDVSGKIGRRYRRQDAIGTPFCITIDYDTLDDEAVTVRERDTMEQKRIKISELNEFFRERLKF
ncbi:glycine--tRNA ligase [Mycoplasmatota bacterium]|nr:glycine--tRNA ligase [Mycoplasmatota bacterium]